MLTSPLSGSPPFLANGSLPMLSQKSLVAGVVDLHSPATEALFLPKLKSIPSDSLLLTRTYRYGNDSLLRWLLD